MNATILQTWIKEDNVKRDEVEIQTSYVVLVLNSKKGDVMKQFEETACVDSEGNCVAEAHFELVFPRGNSTVNYTRILAELSDLLEIKEGINTKIKLQTKKSPKGYRNWFKCLIRGYRFTEIKDCVIEISSTVGTKK